MDYRQVPIGRGLARISIPASYLDQEGEDGVVFVYPPDQQSIWLEFSVLTFQGPEGLDNPGRQLVAQQAEEEGRECVVREDRSISWKEEAWEEDDRPLRLRTYHVGAGNALVVFTASFDDGAREDPPVRDALAELPGIAEGLEILEESIVIETPDGAVPGTRSIREQVPQTVRDLEEAELAGLREAIGRARELVSSFGDPVEGEELCPRVLDAAFAGWLESPEADPSTGEDVAHAVGVAFGQYCVDTLGMRWVELTDEYGSALAIRHESGETTGFPVESVRKRIEEPGTGFLVPIYHALRQQIADCAAAGSSTD